MLNQPHVLVLGIGRKKEEPEEEYKWWWGVKRRNEERDTKVKMLS